MIIKEIINKNDIKNSTEIIKKSFKTVSDEFNLTQQNCPTHPSFINFKKLSDYPLKGIKMFGLFDVKGKQIGFIAVEKADNSTYYLEKLAVLPAYRHLGYGKLLMDFAFNYIKENNGKKVSIAIIDKSEKLKKWYVNYGFKKTGKKEIKHLPFIVCFLEKDVI